MFWFVFKKRMLQWAEDNGLKFIDLSRYKYGDVRVEIEGTYKNHLVKIHCDRNDAVSRIGRRSVTIEVDHKTVFASRPLTRKRIDTPKKIAYFIDMYIDNGVDTSRYNYSDYLILAIVIAFGLICAYLVSLA